MQMFECPQCGASSALAGDRETPACSLCGANARFCGIILAVLQVAFGGSRLPLIQQEPRKDIVAIGVSDSSCYSDLMSQRLQYRNTFFHAEPLLDICDPASCAGYAPADLIVCSDVIEHTADPPHVVLANLHSMLSPGGSLVLSAPTWRMQSSIEWYPAAAKLRIVARPSGYAVEWSNRRGARYVDDHPNFHGGPGETLERRLLSHDELMMAARHVFREAHELVFEPERGYEWPIQPWPDPVVGFSDLDSRIIILRR
jgi:SAM-dependent methyltransferase